MRLVINFLHNHITMMHNINVLMVISCINTSAVVDFCGETVLIQFSFGSAPILPPTDIQFVTTLINKCVCITITNCTNPLPDEQHFYADGF